MPPSWNKVLNRLPRSGIRRIADRFTELKQATHSHSIIHLGLGESQEPTPEPIRQAISRAATNGYTKYTPNAGIYELRHALSCKLAQRNGIHVEADDICITPGATYGVTFVIGSLINPGDEVLVPDPGYPNFAAAVQHYGGKVVYYRLKENNGYQVDIDHLASLITEKTRILIINSPSNPTGAVISQEVMSELVQLTRQNDMWLVSDEVYEAFTYSKKHVSPLTFQDTQHVIGVFSFSKTYNMAGLRVGYIVTTNKQLHTIFIKAQEIYISCAPSVSQFAALEALKSCNSYTEALKKRFRTKRDLALKIFKNDVPYIPQGAYYLLLNIARTGLTSDVFADRLLDTKQVAIAPGLTFGPSSDPYIRIALTPEIKKVEKGLNRIREFVNAFRPIPSKAFVAKYIHEPTAR